MSRAPTVDLVTVAAIGGAVLALTTTLHEGTHGAVCVLGGGSLQELSALHVRCDAASDLHARVVAASGSLLNLAVGVAAYGMLRAMRVRTSHLALFLWLFMLANWLKGSGYWAFSGLSDVGDWAKVIAGAEPRGPIRIGMTVLGFGSFMGFVWLSLRQLGGMIGGTDDAERVGRAARLTVPAYVGALAAVGLAGMVHPLGLSSLPDVAGTIAVAGALSPLVWMAQWFRAAMFRKSEGTPLQAPRSLAWIVFGLAAMILYGAVLGQGIEFGTSASG